MTIVLDLIFAIIGVAIAILGHKFNNVHAMQAK